VLPRSDARPSLVERLLAPIAEVRRQEAASALVMTLMIFLLLAAYYLIKTAREVLILGGGGAEIKSYSSAGQAFLLLFIVPWYGAFASRVSPVRLVTIVTLFFAAHLLLFMAAITAGLAVGIVFFLWVGIFNLMVVAQFWAFAADLYSEEQGKRLFPLIGVGASLGAWLGSMRAGALIEDSGPNRLLAGACVILLICAAMVPLAQRLSAHSRGERRPRPSAPLPPSGGFSLILHDRYLALIAALMFILNVVNTSGEYLFGRYIVEQAHTLYGTGPGAEAERARFIGETYSRFFSTVNLVGFLLQMFVVSRLFRWLGVTGTLFIHPVIALAGYLLLMRAPSLPTIGAFKVADNSVNYSLGNTTRQALWLPTSREAKYKAKQAVDSFFVRMGDVGQAAIVFAGERLAFTVATFASVNVVLSGVWVVVTAMLTATHAGKMQASLSK
jgi:AAA family ATP:ADP antiporter